MEPDEGAARGGKGNGYVYTVDVKRARGWCLPLRKAVVVEQIRNMQRIRQTADARSSKRADRHGLV